MANDIRKFINSAFDPFFQKFGFKRKGTRWYLFKSEYLLVVDFQASHSGEGYYINIGVEFLPTENLYPKEYECSIRYRIAREAPDTGRFDMKNEVDYIQQLIKKRAIDPFAQLDTKHDVSSFVSKNRDE